MDNPFVLPDDYYRRDLNIIATYQHDTAKYLQLQTGQPLEVCLNFIKTQVKPGEENGFHDPEALVLVKNEYGDRSPSRLSFMSFLHRVTEENLLLSPSMAAYMPETRRQSTHALYLEEGVKNRSAVKNEMMEAERYQRHEVAKVKRGEQENFKINNNAYSGATVSQATILHYKSTHSSLTSTCRVATTYANSVNEKFIMGNRHYYDPEITKANLISLIHRSNLTAIQVACETFNLHYPTTDETMACITHSTQQYWRGETHLERLQTMVGNMTPVERAAVVYVNDLYHLHKHNPAFVVEMLQALSSVSERTEDIPDDEYYGYHSDVTMLANFLCFDEVRGRPKDLLLEENPEVYVKIKNTAKDVLRKLHHYAPLIQAFWLTDNLPLSAHAFPSAYRQAVIVSDTDSTIFTLQYWVEQCFGTVSFTPEAKRVVFTLVFMVSEIIAHVLAQMSANMGVTQNKLRLLAMKNEYYFAVLSMTTRSKHYFASQDAQEGLMFATPKMEIKGVGLRDSKVPPRINAGAKKLMEDIIETIKSEQQLNIYEILKQIGDVERDIIASVKSGSAEYMTSGQVKAKESYKNEDNATYMQYELWRDVFAPTLGAVKEPPYSVVKVSLIAGNKTEIDEWCERMNNPLLATRLKAWLLQRRRKDLTTLLIPSTVVETSGIAPEVIAGVDVRKIISNTMGAYYLILESLGIFMQDKRITRLISDFY